MKYLPNKADDQHIDRRFVARLLARAKPIFALAVLVGLAACAAGNAEYLPRDGWRAAKVDAIGSAAKLPAVSPAEDCRLSASPAHREADRYAVVSYWSTVLSRKAPTGWVPRIVPVDAASRWEIGAPIYVNANDCNVPVVARRD